MYWGSVRFYKHLILATIILIIVSLSTAVILIAKQNHGLKNQLQISTVAYSELETQAAGFIKYEADENALAYQKQYPNLYAETPSTYENPQHVAYLTFDDGPSNLTDSVLDILAQKNVKATFFVVGKNLETEQGKERLKRMVAEGHTIGIHTYSHEYTQLYSSVEAYLDDFNRTYELIVQATGYRPEIFRFPGGSINGYNYLYYEQIIAEMTRRGFTYYDWNVSSGDATGKAISADGIIYNVLAQSTNAPYVIVLMHDTNAKQSTLQSLNGMIDGLAKKGYSFDGLNHAVMPIHFSYPQYKN